eukprot:m.195354 g.195354  ORF g.195354 m.195354 type:complete len:92 (-) comp53717_c0_seq12:1427-1702(-)
MAALGRALLQSDVSKFLQATRPLLVNGKWRKPQINARIVAKLRKEAFLSEQVAEISSFCSFSLQCQLRPSMFSSYVCTCGLCRNFRSHCRH